jgi:hypothetical protein
MTCGYEGNPPYMDKFDYLKNRICPICGTDEHLIEESDDFYYCKKCKHHLEMDYFFVMIL